MRIRNSEAHLASRFMGIVHRPELMTREEEKQLKQIEMQRDREEAKLLRKQQK